MEERLLLEFRNYLGFEKNQIPQNSALMASQTSQSDQVTNLTRRCPLTHISVIILGNHLYK